MSTVIGWFLVGMFIWACVMVMEAIQARLAPETGEFSRDRYRGSKRRMKRQIQQRDREIEDLKQRIEVLEAIVTDRRYQWDQEFRGAER